MQRAVVLAVLLCGAAAQAQRPPTAQQKKEAKAHFEQGRAYYEAGAWDDAVREYQAAYVLVPLPDLLFNIGQAHRMKGDKPKAIEAYARYLEKVPDGPLAEDARGHVAALRLRIQLEEAEAARKKAADEAAAARQRADEADAARKRAEVDAAGRIEAQRHDEERLRRLAGEEAEVSRRRKEAAEAEHARWIEEARGRGGVLRTTGTIAIVVGALTVVAIAIPFLKGDSARNSLDKWNQNNSGTMTSNNGGWTTDGDKWVRDMANARSQMLVLGVTGGSLIVAGVVVSIVGSQLRSRAVERVPPVSLAPVPLPGGGALVLGGRF